MGQFLQLLKHFNVITVIHNVFNNVILNKKISLVKNNWKHSGDLLKELS